MGKIKEKIMEFAEMVEQILYSGVTDEELDEFMEAQLSTDEYRMYLAHKDIIFEMLGMELEDEDMYESIQMPRMNEYWDDEKENQRYWDAEEESNRRFKERERNAGEYSDEDERDFVRSQKGLYVKVGKMYMPALYHTPDIGPTDGKLYRKNKKTGGYFPVKG